MGKLIDGDKLISTLVWGHYEIGKQLQTVQKAINDMRGEDAVPVIHAKWEYQELPMLDENTEEPWYICTHCRSGERRKTPYCPNCGARMDADD